MLETSTLISRTGKITRAGLANVPTPPATETHIPIPHALVVETLVETLCHPHIGAVGEEFAVSSDAMEMFGFSTWKLVSKDADSRSEFETRTISASAWHARSGCEVFVCYNLLRPMCTTDGGKKSSAEARSRNNARLRSGCATIWVART